MSLRIGILGAARIAPMAVIRPARGNPEVQVNAIAARDPERARKFARKHGIGKVHDSYDALIADPDVDAIYNPLPNGLHGRWTIAALEAGKHVLCEKPFTANADEARAVAAVAARADRVVMEAFHYRYHPFTERTLAIIESGELGEIRHVETHMCIPLLLRNDIRWDLSLAGGTLMDVGCYALHQLRTYAGAEPEITGARVKLFRPGVDRWARADARFADGRTGRILVSMASTRLLDISARVVGTAGTLKVVRQTTPQYLGSLTVEADGAKRTERPTREPTYSFQLRAFADAVLRGVPFPTTVDDAVKNMEAVDAVYRAAGLTPREPTT